MEFLTNFVWVLTIHFMISQCPLETPWSYVIGMTYFCNQASFHCACKFEAFLSYFGLKTLFFVFSESEFSNLKLNH